ncbi:metalloproteinase 8 [Beauveria brongniartii RCEF 3172]|uniref:deuterolysin n=1 Tax=Beauveria brongniartii RCEF 3172 TaxID=1081107 RepID=A0A162I5D3_9HYPO|nr:metalloproteinase 8 [Beauveria brongniartii RCEF 3172]
MKLELLSFALVQQASCAVLHGRYGAIRSQDLTKELDSQSCVIQGSDADKALFDKRAVDSSCNRFQQDVQRAYEQCAKRARSGAAACKDSKRDDILKAVFHTTDQKARDIVSAHLTQIADECDKKGKGITPLSCLGSGCKPGIAGVTMVWSNGKGGTNPITLCDIKETDDSCGGQDLGDVLLHEMSHSWGRTDDKCYGMAAIQDITSASSLNNADSYTRYAKAADLKCGPDAMMAPGTGGTTPPGTSPGQAPGQEDWQNGQDDWQNGQDDWQDGQDGISPGTGTDPENGPPPEEDGPNGPKIPPGTSITPQPSTPSETGTLPGAGNPPQGSPTPWPGPGITPGQDGDNGNNEPVKPGQQDGDNGNNEPVYPGEQVGEDGQNDDNGNTGPVYPPQNNQNGFEQNGFEQNGFEQNGFEQNGFEQNGQDGFYGQDNFLGNK